MADNEKLADRVRQMILLPNKNVPEKKMFGGFCFMVNEKMCVGVEQERMMIRLDPSFYDEVLEKEGAKPMDFTGRIMKGYVFVDIDTLNTKKKLESWMHLALAYIKSRKSQKRKSFWRNYNQQEIDLIEISNAKINGYEFKYSPSKKVKAPVAFTTTYPAASFERISKDNYFDWIT